MFKIPWIFIPITILYFVILLVVGIILLIKYAIKKFDKQIELDMKKLCGNSVGPIGPIIPVTSIFEFNKQNASSFLNLNLAVSIWSGCSKPLPKIETFDLINTYQGYDYAAKSNRNISALYYSTTLNTIIISFSGTMYLTEWYNDFDFSQTNPTNITKDKSILIHDKQYIMYNTFRNNFISDLNKIKNENTILVVTGHSLGGALATICYFDVISNNVIPSENRTLYAFGSPRVGNVAFANVVNKGKSQFRISNTEDVIIDLPLPINTDGNIYQHINTSGDTIFSMNLGKYGLNHIDAYIKFLQ